MKNKKLIRAVALLLLCCLCIPLMGMSVVSASNGPGGTYCDCTVRCKDNAKNPDCPGCQHGIADCIGKMRDCNCTGKCTVDKRNNDCPACEMQLYACTGKTPEPAPVCGCTVKCKAGAVNTACAVCVKTIANCKGKEQTPPPALSCFCDVKCTATTLNADCPVCAAKVADCKGKAPEPTPAPVCGCAVKCKTGAVNAACAVCMKDLAGCKGKEPEPAPICGCTVKCKTGAVNTACSVCKTDLTTCKGKEAITPPVTTGSYAISIVAPSGWYTKSAKVEIRVEDENDTGWKKVEARIERNGSPEDLTDAFAGGGKVYLPISENCTVYVTVTGKDGKATTKSRYIECFDRTAPTLKTGLDGKVLRVEASDELSGVEAIYIDGDRYTDLNNGTLDVRFRDLGDDYDQLSIQAVDNAGNKSRTVQVKNPNYKAPSSNTDKDKPTTSTPAPTPTPTTPTPTPAPTPNTGSTTTTAPGATAKPSTGSGGTSTVKPSETAETEDEKGPNPFTPDGTATVVDNATDSDGKEFYTIQTPNENVFYLVIDKQRTRENVYFLNAVTEQDLMTLAATDAKTDTTEPEQKPTPTPEVKPEPDTTPQPEAKPDGGNMGTILLVLAVVVIGGGAGWYFKIYRPKHGIPELDEDESEFEDEDSELPPWEDEAPEEQETEDKE